MAGEQFIGESIRPVPGSADVHGLSRGEPGVPLRFTWRGRPYEVAEVLERWKTTGDCRSGSSEQYVRKHWYRVRTTDGSVMRIYCERQARSTRERTRRWWLFSLEAGESPDAG